MNPNEEKVKRLLQFIGDTPTRKEFLDAFKGVIDFVKVIEKRINDSATSLERLFTQRASELKSFVENTLNEFTKNAQKTLDEQVARIDARIAEVKNGEDGEDGEDGYTPVKGVDYNDGEPGKDGSPDTPEEIRNKLETLQGDERLDVSAIKGLDEKLSKVKGKTGMNSGVAGRDIIKTYDLSPYLDGVSKVFAIPGNWTILSVDGSSAPYSFRRLVDFTWTPQQITFTDQIDAGSSLASGQTVQIVYVIG